MNEIDVGQLNAILVRIIEITNADRIEIYPLDDLVQTKIIKGVYKKHLHGLLFKLDMLYVWRNTIKVKNNFEGLPALVLSVPAKILNSSLLQWAIKLVTSLSWSHNIM